MQLLASEEERFANTLNVGMERIGQALDDVRRRGERTLGGEEVFRLYDTYGIPIDLIAEMGEEEGVHVDREGFEEMMKARAPAREGRLEVPGARRRRLRGDRRARRRARVRRLRPVDRRRGERCVALVHENREVEHLARGARRGGRRLADALLRRVRRPDRRPRHARVARRERRGPRHAEAGRRPGRLARSRAQGLARGGRWRSRSTVPNDVRLDTTANHTATHLLHTALKDVLGETVQQAGSLVAPDRLRFDYTWNRPLSEEETREVERIVNDAIRENLEVTKTRDGDRGGEEERRRLDVRREVRREGPRRLGRERSRASSAADAT